MLKKALTSAAGKALKLRTELERMEAKDEQLRKINKKLVGEVAALKQTQHQNVEATATVPFQYQFYKTSFHYACVCRVFVP